MLEPKGPNQINDRAGQSWALFKRRSLFAVNRPLWQAEREFIAGKQWQDIRVRIEYADGSVVEGPQKLPPDKEAWPCR